MANVNTTPGNSGGKQREVTTSGKRPRAAKLRTAERKKTKLASEAITSITPVNFDSSTEEDMGTEGEDISGDASQAGSTARMNRASPHVQTSLEDLEKIIARQMSGLATSAQLQTIVGKVEKNESEIKGIKEDIARIHSKLDEKPERRGSEPTSPPKNRRPVDRKFGPGRELSFHMSRKSLRIWPIKGSTDPELRVDLMDFITNALRVPATEAEAIRIERIRRTRSAPQAISHHEVCVTFTSVDDRDYIAGRSYNLSTHIDDQGKPQAGVRMDIPGFLMPTFKDLNTYGRIARNTYGKDIRKYIKFDDDELDLFLEIRLPGSTNWLRIAPPRARELIADSAEGELRSMQTMMRRSRASSEGDSLSSTSRGASIRSSSSTYQPESRSSSQSWRPTPRSPSTMGFGR